MYGFSQKGEVLGALFKPRQSDSVPVKTPVDGNINVGQGLLINSVHMVPDKIPDEKIDDIEEIKKKLKILVVCMRMCMCVYR